MRRNRTSYFVHGTWDVGMHVACTGTMYHMCVYECTVLYGGSRERSTRQVVKSIFEHVPVFVHGDEAVVCKSSKYHYLDIFHRLYPGRRSL